MFRVPSADMGGSSFVSANPLLLNLSCLFLNFSAQFLPIISLNVLHSQALSTVQGVFDFCFCFFVGFFFPLIVTFYLWNLVVLLIDKTGKQIKHLLLLISNEFNLLRFFSFSHHEITKLFRIGFQCLNTSPFISIYFSSPITLHPKFASYPSVCFSERHFKKKKFCSVVYSTLADRLSNITFTTFQYHPLFSVEYFPHP